MTESDRLRLASGIAGLTLVASLSAISAQPRPAELPRPLQLPAAAKPSATPITPLDLELELVLPTPERLFRTESEATVRGRLRAEAERQKRRAEFPNDAGGLAAPVPGIARVFPPAFAPAVPGVVCHRPLYFEDRNTERFGWTFPVLQPAASTGRFYLDTVMLPFEMLLRRPWSWECDDVSPAPGDPVPYHLHLSPNGWGRFVDSTPSAPLPPN